MSKLAWRGKAVTGQVRAGAAEGLTQLAKRIEGSSNQRAPRDTQDMINTSTVTVEGLTAAVSYDTPYAVRQHEDLTYRHAPGRTAKFLEQAAQEHAPGASGIVGAAIAAKLR